MNTLLLINSSSPGFIEYETLLRPFLDHLGLPYFPLDIHSTALPRDISGFSLIIVAHPQLDPGGSHLRKRGQRSLQAVVRNGAGLVSFDPQFPAWLQPREAESGQTSWEDKAGEIEFSEEAAGSAHPITALHPSGERLRLVGGLEIPSLALGKGRILCKICSFPLAVAHPGKTGRVVQWASLRWLLTSVLGPLGGLDDVLWRSLVWAARKPFVLRGLPPLVAMRVDDVAGQGDLWQQSPLYWAQAANRWGLKPWMGLFLGNLTPQAVNEARELAAAGRATVFPHAFGRQPRPGYLSDYDENVFPLSDPEKDEFIYFNHYQGCPYPANETQCRLDAVDRWITSHAPLPISRYAIPHWYEIGRDAAQSIGERWGIEMIGKLQDFDLPLSDEVPWLKGGPFRLFEEPGTPFFEPALRGDRPVYYADFITLGERRFFNCLTEIRDDTGYEWAPDNEVDATVMRGVRQLRRAMQSMALAVLFTHETDFIWKIRPENWEEILKRITAEIASDHPVFLTLDEGVRYVRATRTSRLVSAHWDEDGSQRIKAVFAGNADLPTHCCVFTEREDEMITQWIEVPQFEGQVTVTIEADSPSLDKGVFLRVKNITFSSRKSKSTVIK